MKNIGELDMSKWSVHEEYRGTGHVKIKSVQVNSKSANAFRQRQLKYVDLSHKTVKYPNKSRAYTVTSVRTQKDSTVHGKDLAWVSEWGGGDQMRIPTDCVQNISF